MKGYTLEKNRLRTMASGHLCLELTESIGWDQFPDFGEQLAATIGAEIFEKAEGIEMRIWRLKLPAGQVRLVQDDFPFMVSLESDSIQGDAILKNLSEQFGKDRR